MKARSCGLSPPSHLVPTRPPSLPALKNNSSPLIERNPPQRAGAPHLLLLLRGADAAGDPDAAAVAPAGGLVDVADAILVKDVDLAALVLVLLVGEAGVVLLAHSGGGGDEGAEEEVLHDGQLAQDLDGEHAAHAGLDLGPALGAADVVEHGTVPAQALDRLGAVDEGDLAQVHVVGAKLLEGQLLVDGKWGDEGVVEELAGAEEEGEKLVVVEAPDAVGPGGFEVVGGLDEPHDVKVAGEDAEGEGGEVGAMEDGQLIEAQEPDHKVELVAGAVVDAHAVSERVAKVRGQLGGGVGVAHAEAGVPSRGALFYLVEKETEGLIAESRAALVVRGRLPAQGLSLIEDGEDGPDGLAQRIVFDG